MQKSKIYISRTSALIAAATVLVAVFIPILMNGIAKAGIPTSRKITLDSSAGAATDVTYTVQFTTDQGGAASNIGGVVVEFCDSSPIIGDSSCTTPSGFNINKATLALGTQVGVTGFAVDTTNSDANTLILTRTASSIASAVAVTIPLGTAAASDGITNPTLGNHTFYARVLTYAATATAQAYTSATPGTYVDAGGIALSTANTIQITAKVQERLSFCVYVGGSCTTDTTGAATTSAFNLGNTNGVLDPAGPYVDRTAKFDISTNALSGATIVMKGDTLKSGAFDITAIGSTAATATAGGSEQFGMCLFQSTGSGMTFPNATYPSAGCSGTTQTAGTASTGGATGATFGFNTTNTLSASGDTIATKPAGNTSTATMAFVGNIGFVTEAGIYQTTLTYIATGQY